MGKKPQIVRVDMCRRIAQIRVEHDLNQKELGEILGMTQAGVSSIENFVNNPAFDTIIIICEYFGISYNWLFMGEGEKYVKNIAFKNYIEKIKLEYLEILKKETENIKLKNQKTEETAKQN